MKLFFPMFSLAVVPLVSAGIWVAAAGTDPVVSITQVPSSSQERGTAPATAERKASGFHTTLESTAQGRQRIKAKLEQIRLDEVFYDQIMLQDVIINIRDEAERRDPEKIGVNFMIVNRNESPVLPQFSDPSDPMIRLIPRPQPIAPLGEAVVGINPPLKHLRLIDVLDAIVKQSSVPIQYSIEEYAVVFSNKTPPEITQVFSLASYLAGKSDQQADQALKELNEVFEITWGLHQQSASSQLRFAPRLHLHRGTKLLIAVGQPEQLNIIAQVLNPLPTEPAPPPARNPPKP